MNSPAHEGRWWQRLLVRTSVRGLMLLVLLIGIGLGWVVNKAHVQRDAVATIKRAGGSVRYDYEYLNGGSIPKGKAGKPWVPAWLRKRVGDEYFQNVTMVQLSSPTPQDGTMEALKGLDRLEVLLIGNTSKIGDGLRNIAKVGNLRAIVVVKGMGIDDSRLACLSGLRRLSELDIRQSAVTDAGLAHLPKFGELRRLNLPGSGISDAGLLHLVRISGLQSLNLNGTRVTDAGMVHLQRLPGLELLHIGNTNVTAAGVAELQKVLPKLKIIRR